MTKMFLYFIWVLSLFAPAYAYAKLSPLGCADIESFPVDYSIGAYTTNGKIDEFAIKYFGNSLLEWTDDDFLNFKQIIFDCKKNGYFSKYDMDGLKIFVSNATIEMKKGMQSVKDATDGKKLLDDVEPIVNKIKSNQYAEEDINRLEEIKKEANSRRAKATFYDPFVQVELKISDALDKHKSIVLDKKRQEERAERDKILEQQTQQQKNLTEQGRQKEIAENEIKLQENKKLEAEQEKSSRVFVGFLTFMFVSAVIGVILGLTNKAVFYADGRDVIKSFYPLVLPFAVGILINIIFYVFVGTTENSFIKKAPFALGFITFIISTAMVYISSLANNKNRYFTAFFVTFGKLVISVLCIFMFNDLTNYDKNKSSGENFARRANAAIFLAILAFIMKRLINGNAFNEIAE